MSFSTLLRRADTVDVMGQALLAKAAGAGHRSIAAVLDRPVSTVRGWLRRFGATAGLLLGPRSMARTAANTS